MRFVIFVCAKEGERVWAWCDLGADERLEMHQNSAADQKHMPAGRWDATHRDADVAAVAAVAGGHLQQLVPRGLGLYRSWERTG